MINTSITEVFTCECRPGFNWKNKKTYKIHKNSIRHKNYETLNEDKQNRININKMQIELNRLKLENNKLRELFLNTAKENMELKKNVNTNSEYKI